MTDVRDPEPLTATRSPGEVVAPRRSLIIRALSPIRRVTGREMAVVRPATVELRDASLELEPKRSFSIVRWSLLVLVALPTFATMVYLFAFASDQYMAETQFMVRQAEPLVGGDTMSTSKKAGDDGGAAAAAAANPAAAMSGTINLGGEDAEIVASYINSRAIIDDISRTLDIRAIFQRPEADPLARLPRDASAEAFTRYWNQMVAAHLEAMSGIVTVSVSAFRREDALKLAEAILQSSARLVNDLSTKVRMDMMKTAEDEVRRSEGEVRFALANLTSFRNSRQVIDPVKSAESNGKLLYELMTSKIEAESQLFVAERVQGPNAPGMTTLRDKLTSINDHVAQLKEQMAGNKAMSSNMASVMEQFETLELKKQFAEAMYTFASNGVERARIASERQQVYLEPFEPPSLPQDYTYPRRWADTALVFFGCLMIWTCGATITASVIDHRL